MAAGGGVSCARAASGNRAAQDRLHASRRRRRWCGVGVAAGCVVMGGLASWSENGSAPAIVRVFRGVTCRLRITRHCGVRRLCRKACRQHRGASGSAFRAGHALRFLRLEDRSPKPSARPGTGHPRANRSDAGTPSLAGEVFCSARPAASFDGRAFSSMPEFRTRHVRLFCPSVKRPICSVDAFFSSSGAKSSSVGAFCSAAEAAGSTRDAFLLIVQCRGRQH